MNKFRFSAARYSLSVDIWVELPNIADDDPESVIQYKVREMMEMININIDCCCWDLFDYKYCKSAFSVNFSTQYVKTQQQTRIISSWTSILTKF